MTSDPLLPRADERLLPAQAMMAVLASTSSERQVRPMRDAVDAARQALAARDGRRATEALDAVEAYSALLAVAEAQLSVLERSVRTDIESGTVLEAVRTGAQVRSAIDVATAVAATRAMLLDVDRGRATGSRHDPAELLVLLAGADAEIDAAVSGYRRPHDQARRQLVLLESLRLAARLRADAVQLLLIAHGERISEAVRILLDETRERMRAAAARVAADPRGALALARDAAAHGDSALAEAQVDLDGPGAPVADGMPGRRGWEQIRSSARYPPV